MTETPLLSLTEAMTRLNAVKGDRSTRAIGLACSFTPLHLQTFLGAYLLELKPDERFDLRSGIYGDLVGTLRQFAALDLDAAYVAVEWADLDPRLSPRSAAAVDPLAASQMARENASRILDAARALAVSVPVVVSLPATPLPESVRARTGQVSAAEAALRAEVADLAHQLAVTPKVRVVADPSPGHAHDVRNDLRSGLPHPPLVASGLARGAAHLIYPAPPKKGLITDLDDTLWRGLVGEIGPDAVTWRLEDGAQLHAMYQQFLAGLAGRGVLLAVASKNDPDVAAKAFERTDLDVDASRFFPIEVSWGAKSEAVARALSAWNIAASDVVFVDDSPLELAEVAAAHPDITALRFEGSNPDSVVRLLSTLREFFWRDGDVSAEDAIRLDSLRTAADAHRSRNEAATDDEFLANLHGEVTIDLAEGWREPRALELVNKTNQFNLNGRRVEEGEWQRLADRPGGFIATVGYRDKFGPLGTISVIGGQVADDELNIDFWVLSCRAFSRAIEFHMLRELVQALGVQSVTFDFTATDRNGPAGELLDGFDPSLRSGGALPAGDVLSHQRGQIHSVSLLRGAQ